jgi:predicted nuclease of restriction endonuclease-like (RecB) superfamily
MQTMVSSQTLPRSTLPDGYPQLLARLKRKIGAARTRAALAVNEELIGLYWRIGSEILEREEAEGWGAKVVSTLSRDLRSAFPEMKGLAERNLRYMRDFARSWPDESMLPQAVAKLPWGHVRCLLDKLNDPAARLWYAQHAVEH